MISLREFRRRIKVLPEQPPVTEDFERALRRLGAWGRRPVWYKSQKERWLGWLREYGGPGYYGRANWDRSPEFVYNHVNCPPMVLWLGEAAGVAKRRVVQASQSALSAGPHRPSRSAAIRKLIPWKEVEAALAKRGPVGADEHEIERITRTRA